MDTDVTPLMDPDLLFETEAFKREGALFWPDLWGKDCGIFGQTAWPHHIVWHLLGLEYNASDPNYVQEHEAGHVLVDRERHWRPLCLANYLASRDFFTQTMHGYKDVFRLAWLKLNAAGSMMLQRPGLVGSWTVQTGEFLGSSLLHFWPLHHLPEPILDMGPLARIKPDEMNKLGLALKVSELPDGGRLVPLYVHQKKKPGSLWMDVVTFKPSLGSCITYSPGGFFDPNAPDLEAWSLEDNHVTLAEMLVVVETFWDRSYQEHLEKFKANERLTAQDIERLHRVADTKATAQFKRLMLACPCDYSDNRWFTILTQVMKGSLVAEHLDCPGMATEPTKDCPVGHAYRALLCASMALREEEGDREGYLVARRVLAQLEPSLRNCLADSFWPMQLAELQSYLQDTEDGREAFYMGEVMLKPETLLRFPDTIRRCLPARDPTCWSVNGPVRSPFDVRRGPGVVMHADTSCLYCCDPALAAEAMMQGCFDEEYASAAATPTKEGDLLWPARERTRETT